MPRLFTQWKLIFLVTGVLLAGKASGQYTIDITKYSESIYIYESYASYQGNKTGANAIVVIGKDSVVVIDTPWDEDQTRQLIEWVAKEIKKPIASFVITHFHADRIGGIAVLKEKGIPAVSSERTADLATADGYPRPDVLFENDTTLVLDDKKIEVFYPGPGHTHDNVVVYVPSEKVLYGGCFLKSGESTSLGNLSDADTKAWPASLDKLQAKFPDPALVIPGHGKVEPGAIENTRKLLKEFNK